MFDLEDKSLQCPRDGCTGILDYLPTDGVFVCATCCYEVSGESSRKVTTSEAMEVYKLQRRHITQMRKPGGSSNSSKNKKRKKAWRPEGVQPYFRDYDEV